MKMRISFDLDGTILFRSGEAPVERDLPPLRRVVVDECLRQGVTRLFHSLAELGCEIWIYTNSYRGENQLRDWFAECGLPVRGVINQVVHDAKKTEIGRFALRPLKCPPWFGIDLHVDDSELVKADGDESGFAVLLLSPEDDSWVDTVLAEVRDMLAEAERSGKARRRR